MTRQELLAQPGNILIVDDNPTNLRVLAEVLEQDGHSVMAARDGARAIKIAATARPELILLDVMMPEMDGYEVCRHLKSDAATEPIPIIFITANDQTDAMVTGFDAGAVDFIPKPFRQAEVQARVRAHLNVFRLTEQLEERNQALEEKNRLLAETTAKLDETQRQQIADLEEELRVAHDLQMGLMPKESPGVEGLEIAARCLPAAQVGGDFYQYFHHGERLSISTADVTGHAMQAAIPVVMFDGILDSQILLGHELEDLFQRLNDRLAQKITGHTHVCFAMAQIDLGTKAFRFANAGCPYPVHYHAASRGVSELCLNAYPLGVRSGTRYAALDGTLEPGDRIVFCSDGIMEAVDADDRLFGYERTAEVVAECCRAGHGPEQIVERLLSDARSFRGERPQEDDQTIVVVGAQA